MQGAYTSHHRNARFEIVKAEYGYRWKSTHTLRVSTSSWKTPEEVVNFLREFYGPDAEIVLPHQEDAQYGNTYPWVIYGYGDGTFQAVNAKTDQKLLRWPTSKQATEEALAKLRAV